MMRSFLFSTAGLVLAGAVLALTPSQVGAVEGRDDAAIQMLVQFAETPREHRALAQYYSAKAVAARMEAEKHRTMSNHYGGNQAMKRAAKEHCNALVKANEDAATQYDALSEMHAREAGEE